MSFVVLDSAYAVFDALGGLAGERVTGAACNAFRVGVAAHGDVTQALRGANDAVRAAVDRDATLRGAGCTAAALRLRPGLATIAWAGDVHVLLFRAGCLRSVTREHSVLNENAAVWSKLPPSKRNELAGVVVRALGMARELDVEVQSSSVEPADVFALLSDSLLYAVGKELLLSLLDEYRNDLCAGVRALIDAGQANGGRGALTVVLAAAGGTSPASVAADSEMT